MFSFVGLIDNVNAVGMTTIGQASTTYNPHTSSWATGSALTLIGNYGGGLAFNDNNNAGYSVYLDTSGQNFYIKNVSKRLTKSRNENGIDHLLVLFYMNN